MTELTPSCLSSQTVLVVEGMATGDKYWKAEGFPVPAGSVATGHGYAADAQLFPPGTRLTVTAVIEIAEKGDGNAQD